MHPKHNHTKMRFFWLMMALVMLLVAACKDGDDGTANAAAAESTPTASMYTLSPGDQAATGEVYVALDGDRARVYQYGSTTSAVFALGTFPVVNDHGTLTIALTQADLLKARTRLGLRLEAIAAWIVDTQAADTPSGSSDSRLEQLRTFLESELADEMDVEDALEAFDEDSGLMAVAAQIEELRAAYFSQCANGDPVAALLLAKARLGAAYLSLLGDERVLKVFQEKEILGSLLKDTAAIDGDIALYYTNAARILRGEPTGLDELDEIDEIATELDELETLCVEAAVLEGHYLRFMARLGFNIEATAQDQAAITLWNATLWGGLMTGFAADEREQFHIQPDICQPLEGLVRHCSMSGDAARAMRTIQLLERLAKENAGGRIILKPADGGWSCPGASIVLHPVTDASLTDWRLWEQWADEIDRRI